MQSQQSQGDFHLLVLDHPGTAAEAVSKGVFGNKPKFSFAILDVFQYTSRGDLVLLEMQDAFSFEDFLLFNQWKKRHLKDKFEETLRKEWEAGEKQKWNFYAELAEQIKAIGRSVGSLEPDSVKPGGKLLKIEGKPYTAKAEGFDVKREAHLLSGIGRTPSQILRIKSRKPQMVIAAEGHGVIFEKVLKPKSVTWHMPINAREKARAIAEYKKYLNAIKRMNQRRRQIINERLMNEGKLPKMKAKRDKKKRLSPK